MVFPLVLTQTSPPRLSSRLPPSHHSESAMFSVNHAAGSTSIPQGFQDPQYPVPGFFPAYYPWQSYPLLETSRPPLATVPNAILPPASSFNPSTDGFSTGPSSAMANYQGQNAVYPPQNMIAPTFHIQNACFQRTIYPFADMYLGNMVSAPLVAGDGGQAQAAAAAPAPFQWPLPMQGGAETHASQGQADQQDLVDTVYAQGYPSLPQQDQTSVGYEVQPLNQAGPSNDLGSSALRQKSALRPQKKLAKKVSMTLVGDISSADASTTEGQRAIPLLTVRKMLPRIHENAA